MSNELTVKNGLISQGNVSIFGNISCSVITASSVTASLLGTSSYANNSMMANTASYITANNITGVISSASYSVSASYYPIQLSDITDNTSVHYIGINQTNPQYTLDVNGTIGNSHNSTWISIGGNNILSIGDVLNVANNAILNCDGTNFWFSPNTVRVGIGGITSPRNALDIIGNISCSIITASIFNPTFIDLPYSSSGHSITPTINTGSSYLYTTGSTNLLYIYNGNVWCSSSLS
jgi:hypothetical protein